jgi:rhamnose transport system substrate-binding protein
MYKKIIALLLLSLILPLLAACGGETPTATAVPAAAPTATTAPAAPAATDTTAPAAAATNTTAAPAATDTTAPAAAATNTTAAPAAGGSGRNYVLVPKNLGNPYFDTANKGAQAAAQELGATVTYQGPATADATQQIQLLNSLIAQHVQGLAISADDSDALVPVGKQAIDQGIPVVSWDAAIAPGGRTVHINQANAEDIGRGQIQLISKLIGGKGKIAILSATSTAPNQNEWIKWMKDELTKPENSGLQLVATVYGDDQDEKSYTEAQGLMQTYPDLKGIISPTTVGIAAAARSLSESAFKGKVKLTGLGTPNQMRPFVEDGTVDAFALWNPGDLGYLAVFATQALVDGDISGEEGDTFEAGKLGEFTVGADGVVLLGDPFVFDKANIGDFDF